MGYSVPFNLSHLSPVVVCHSGKAWEALYKADGGSLEVCVPSGNVTLTLNSPPSHSVFSFPGTPHSHILRSSAPCAFLTGLAKNPNGWSLRHCLLQDRNVSGDVVAGVRCMVAMSDGSLAILRDTYRSSCKRFWQRDIVQCFVVDQRDASSAMSTT